MMAKARSGGKLDAPIPVIALPICCMIATEARQAMRIQALEPARLCRHGKQGGQRQPRVWRTHEGFTDEEGVHVGT